MADPSLAVLLRNGNHATATIKYALKCNDVAISYARTPIQIPIAQQSPEIIDLGFYRPSITVTGLVDTVGGDSSNTTLGFAGMESITYTRGATSATTVFSDGGSGSAQTYYIPYKNALEEAVANWLFLGGSQTIQLEIGDAKYPISSYGGYLGTLGAGSPVQRFSVASQHATGGAIYDVAIQQGRFSLNAAKEDRYDFSLQFVATSRIDTPSAA
jgi:hypothetical protein